MTEFTTWAAQVIEALRRELSERAAVPESTYRLQLDREAMTFCQAAAIVPYLRELGISHLYTSPDRKAKAGSPHGYAIVDYDSVNPELGSEEDYRAMVSALWNCRVGRLPDIVPNHMSAAPGENPWWTDVLENGSGSPYAACFDIDWDPVKEELKNRVLLPLLGGQYGEVLESGEMRVEYRDGAFSLRLYGARLPLDPKTYPQVLGRDLDRLKQQLPPDSPYLLELESILTAVDHLPDRNVQAAEHRRERQREKEVVKKRLSQLASQCAAVAEFIEGNLTAINGTVGQPESFDALDRLLDAQVYRLAHWKAAGDEINYRRFFDINDLAAVCMEDPAVFERGHRLVFEMLVRGEVSGLRIDHIDGLFDPTEYLWQLQRGWVRALGQKILHELTSAAGQTIESVDTNADIADGLGGAPYEYVKNMDGPADSSDDSVPTWADLEPAVFEAIFGQQQKAVDGAEKAAPPLFVEVEKILGPEEPLPPQWPVAGTTGYDFLRSVNGLFVDPDGLKVLTKAFDRFVGRTIDLREVVYESKHSILRSAMSSELQLLARRLNRLSERHRRFRDFTLNTLRHALREIIACFAVYRTYLRPDRISERDRRFVIRAVAQAKRRNADIAPGAFDFIRDVLLFEQPTALSAEGCRERQLFVGRFQQVTSPVMAKGVEDTAFYRYFPLSSLNDVGDDPAARPVGVEDFHRENAARRKDWPSSMLGTTTHDTKRSEDVRARINVLSEMPRHWSKLVNLWARLNRRHHCDVDGLPAPSRRDEYLFYQSLLGIWPSTPPDAAERGQLIARLQAYMEKATHEAKLHTSWLNPNAEYDAAVKEFVAAVLEPGLKNRFLAQFTAFQGHIARFGVFNALAQVLLKLTSPGVPDIYQGQELWDFSLVDPDNRRPVDFELRRRLLAELQCEVSRGPDARRALAERLAADPADPRMKLFVTWQTLHLRRENAELFRRGQYTPLVATGARADHVCAFAWQAEENDRLAMCRAAIVVVPRLLARLSHASANSRRDGADGVSPLEIASVGQLAWQDTCVALPSWAARTWTHVFTGRARHFDLPTLSAAEIFADFPVALLLG